MRYLDTNTVIAWANGVRVAEARFDQSLPDVGVSTVVLGEMLFGARNLARAAENLARIEDFVKLVHVAPYDAAYADVDSRLRLNLKQRGRPCSDADMMIAATALAHDATLVTQNTRHFEPISGLSLENWLVDGN